MANSKLEDVIAIQRRWEQNWLAQPGVTGVDTGYRMVGGQPTDVLVIRIYVSSKSGAPPEILTLKKVEGTPVDIIERAFELH